MLNWSTPSDSSSRELRDVVLDGAEHAEAVDDLVRDELRVGVAGPAVVAVVVALARADVVGQGVRDLAVLAVGRTRSATWLPTIPPNQRHWSRAWARSSPR